MPHRYQRLGRPRVLLAVEAFRAYGRQVAEGVACYVHEHAPWDVIFERSARRVTTELFRKHQPLDGVIAEAGGLAPRRLVHKKRRVPVVFVEETKPDWPQVFPDDRQIGRMAGEYFAGLGLRNLAYLGTPGAGFSDLRNEGFAEVARQRGLGSCQAPFSLHDANGRRRLADWLPSLPRPVGLLVIMSTPGQAVLEACYRLELRVPEDIAVLAVENDEVFCDLCIPPLSAIDHNTRRVGYEAAAMLARLLRGEPLEQHRLPLPPKAVVQRKSTEIIAARNPHVVHAVRYIQDHVEEPLGAAEVLRNVPVGRRTLEQAFRRHLDCSIEEHICNERIAKARLLLVDTAYSVTDIAYRCGFGSSATFCRVFRRLVHTTPSAYRKEHSLRG